MIELKNACYAYKPARPVIRNASASLTGGNIYGLLGLNGTGKTTLLKLMAGMLFPKSGQVLSDGQDADLRTAEMLGQTALMPAGFSLPSESLTRFVSLNAPFYPGFSRPVLLDGLSAFGIGTDTKNLATLSPGQRHKFLLAFLLSLGCRHLLLDEPLNGMDAPSRTVFRKLLARHLRDDQTVVISTHVLTDVERILTHAMILRTDGTLFCRSLEEIGAAYCFAVTPSPDGALYAENGPAGYRTLRPAGDGEGTETDIPLDLLFNAVSRDCLR